MELFIKLLCVVSVVLCLLVGLTDGFSAGLAIAGFSALGCLFIKSGGTNRGY